MRWWASRSRALALVLFTAASVGVFASPLVRASNSIGQDLGVWQGEEYRLILGEERRTLYQGERLLFTEERSSEGARIVVRRQDDDGQVTVTIIEDGHPIQRQTGGEKTLYQYDDEGRLLLRTILVDDHIVAVEAFSYRFEELSAVATLGSDENLRTFFHRGDEQIYAYSIKGEGESYTQRSEGERSSRRGGGVRNRSGPPSKSGKRAGIPSTEGSASRCTTAPPSSSRRLTLSW